MNDDRRALRRHGLLRRALKIAGLLGALAHHLDGVRYILLLVVISIAERRRPGQIFVHISQDGRKGGERLDAGIPGLLVHSLSQSVTL